MAIEGVDYAWSRPDIAQLAAAGKRFACRYGGPGSDGKQLHADEAQALSAAGVAIVANAEGSATGLLGGWSAGADWARRADAHFRACGMPPDRPIYLSVDFGVTSDQWLVVREALRGAASVIGVARVGVYGGRRAIEWARRDGVAAWFWQTYAWSYGYWVPGNHIEQYQNGVSLAGATLDLDRALTSDFGQWTIGDDDMQLSDEVPSAATPDTPDRSVDQVFGDVWRATHIDLHAFIDETRVALAELKAAIQSGPISDEQLERVLRKVIGSVDQVAPQS